MKDAAPTDAQGAGGAPRAAGPQGLGGEGASAVARRRRISGPRREPTAGERHDELEAELGHKIAAA